MGEISQYLFSVAAAGIICGIINGLFKKESAYGNLVNLLTGVFLLITLISPLISIQIEDMSVYFDNIQSDGELYKTEGDLQAQYAKQAIIKSQTEAYILDKAATLGIEVTADVQFLEDEPYVPHLVVMQGAVSPYSKKVLSDYMSDTLGIQKENQRWI